MKMFGLENRFSPFWANFGGSTDEQTSKSSSSQFLALDAPILRSIRPKNLRKMSVGAPKSNIRKLYTPLNIAPPYGLSCFFVDIVVAVVVAMGLVLIVVAIVIATSLIAIVIINVVGIHLQWKSV